MAPQIPVEGNDALDPKQQPLRDEVSKAFSEDKVQSATEEDLARWLKTLATVRTKVVKNRSRDIIRAAFIHHIQHTRKLEVLNSENCVLAQRNNTLQEHIRRLTIAALIAGFIATGFAGWQIWNENRAYNLANTEHLARLEKDHEEAILKTRQ